MSRKCVFQKEFLVGLYAKCRELIQRCCMEFIQTWQRFSKVIWKQGNPFFSLFFFSNNFRFSSYKYVTSHLYTLKYTDQPICDFYWWPRAKQTTNSNMVWYLNMNKSTYSHWSKHVGENLPSAMHFIYLFIFVTFRFFFSEIARLWSLIMDTFCFVHNPSE